VDSTCISNGAAAGAVAQSRESRRESADSRVDTASGHAKLAIPLLVQRVVTVGVPVLVGILVSRYLGNQAFGEFSIVLATVSGLQVIGEFGLDKYLPREFVETGTDLDIFRQWVGFKLELSLFLYAAAIFLCVLVRGQRDVTLALIVYGASLLVAPYTTTYRSHFIAREQTHVIAAAAGLGNGFSFALCAVLLVSAWRSLTLVAAVLSVCSLLELMVLVHLAVPRIPLWPRFANPFPRAAGVWEFGLQTILSAIYTRVGIYALGFFGGALAVATYSKAWTIYSAMSLVPAAAAIVSYPALVRAAHEGESGRFIGILVRNVAHVAGLLVPAVVLVMWFGKDILRLLYPGTLDPTSLSVLNILLASYVLFLVNSALPVGLFALHAQTITVKFGCVSLGWCVMANIFLASRGLATGTAWATLLSEVATTVLFVPLLISRLSRNKAQLYELADANDTGRLEDHA
jgi:O-antigen/teichoic acid export membrane protein